MLWNYSEDDAHLAGIGPDPHYSVHRGKRKWEQIGEASKLRKKSLKIGIEEGDTYWVSMNLLHFVKAEWSE
jgi:hypothetical protein